MTQSKVVSCFRQLEGVPVLLVAAWAFLKQKVKELI